MKYKLLKHCDHSLASQTLEARYCLVQIGQENGTETRQNHAYNLVLFWGVSILLPFSAAP